MENGEASVSSTAPLTWHDFLERMRHPSASYFVESIKSFILSFSNNVPDPEKDSAAVQEFLANMEAAFRAHSLWAGCSEEELESAGEGLEKYVITKLFTRAFASLPEDVKRDEELSEKIALIQQFISPENLDIKPSYQSERSWLLAQKQLEKINMYKAPRDKLACILNCCRVINDLLLNASIASKDDPPGADEFLPLLIYITIKANPPQLHSNLLYIQRYRCWSRLVSEAAYFFTNMLSVESFIWKIDAKSLSMDEAEFEKKLECGRAILSGLSLESLPNQRVQGNGHLSTSETKGLMLQSPKSKERTLTNSETTNEAESKGPELPKKPSISDLEKKGAVFLVEEEDATSSFRQFRFLYAHLGDLTLDDVEALLCSYKQLVLKYVSLSKALGISNPMLPVPIRQTQTETSNHSEDTASVAVDDENKKEIRSTDSRIDGGPFMDIDSSLSKSPPAEPVTNFGVP